MGAKGWRGPVEPHACPWLGPPGRAPHPSPKPTLQCPGNSLKQYPAFWSWVWSLRDAPCSLTQGIQPLFKAYQGCCLTGRGTRRGPASICVSLLHVPHT